MRFLRMNLVLVALLLAACSSPEGECGEGESVDGFCAYSAAIVIEGGFTCPALFPMRFDFGDVTLCGAAAANADAAESACARGGFECGPPPCTIAPEDEECVSTPTDGGVLDAGFGPCDAGPIDFCREPMPELGEGCCGAGVSPLCRIGGSGYACPEGSIPTSECAECP